MNMSGYQAHPDRVDIEKGGLKDPPLSKYGLTSQPFIASWWQDPGFQLTESTIPIMQTGPPTKALIWPKNLFFWVGGGDC